MQILTTTPLATLLVLGLLIAGPARGLWLLVATFPLAAAASINLPGLGSLSLTDTMVLAAWATLVLHRVPAGEVAGTLRPGRPGFALLLLVIVTAIGAVFLPRVMMGMTEVYVLTRQDGAAAIVLEPLGPVSGNVTQLVRFVIAASVFVLLATVFRLGGGAARVRTAMLVATLLHLLLTLLDLGSYAAGLPNLLDVIRTANMAMLDNQVLFGLKRVVGGFPEPSAYSYYTIGLFAFWLRLWLGDRASWRAGLLALLLLALLLRSTSSSAYVSLGLFGLLFLGWHAGDHARRARAMWLHLGLVTLLPALAGGLILAYAFVPAFATFVDSNLFGKLSTGSGIERMEWNAQAMRNFVETLGLGAGIGSVRASSWLATCFGSLGLAGTALFLWFVAGVLRARAPEALSGGAAAQTAAALQTGCVAVLIQSLVTKPYPNLEVPFFAMAGLAVGLLRREALRGRVPRAGRARIGAGRRGAGLAGRP